MIDVTFEGDFKKTEKFLNEAVSGDIYLNLDRYGKRGVNALATATPVKSGETANSWGYRVIRNPLRPGIEWYNTHVNDGANIAILIQYGHATGTGGYVEGRDYINPAIQPIFDQIAEDLWNELRRR